MKRRSRPITDQSVRETDLTTLLDGIIRRAMEIVRGKSGAVYLWDDAAGVLVPHAWVGIGDFLQKPFTPDTLVQTVRAALDQPGTASGAERGSETRT